MVQWMHFFRTLLLIAAGAGIALAFVAREDSAPTNQPPVLSAENLRELYAQLQQIQRKLQRLEQGIASTRSEDHSARVAVEKEVLQLKRQMQELHRQAPLSEIADSRADPVMEAESQQQSAGGNDHVTPMSDKYLSEVRDESWATHQERSIERVLQNSELYKQLHLENIDCRSSSCQLRIERRGETARHVEQVLLGQLGRDLPHAAWQEHNGTIELTLSLHELP